MTLCGCKSIIDISYDLSHPNAEVLFGDVGFVFCNENCLAKATENEALHSFGHMNVIVCFKWSTS